MKRVVVYCYTFSSERKSPIPGEPVLTAMGFNRSAGRRRVYLTPPPQRSGDGRPGAEGGPGPQA